MTTTSQQEGLRIILTAGPQDMPRSMFALELALTSALSGLATEVYLALDATAWACTPDKATGARVYALLDQLTALGVSITCCSTCVLDRCTGHGPRAATSAAAVETMPSAPPTRNGIRVEGLTTLIERLTTSMRTVTF